MATIEQLKQALVLADQAGDFENASVLAAAIKQQMEAEKAQIVPLRPGEVAPEFKEPSLMDKLIGGIESDISIATGMTTGAVGYISGLMYGTGKAIGQGTFGTPEGNKQIQETAEKTAEKYTYTPKTETGKEITERVGGMMTNLMAFGPHPEMMTGDVSGAMAGASPIVKAKGAEYLTKAQNVTKPVVEIAKKPFQEKPLKVEDVAALEYKASKGNKKAEEKIIKLSETDPEAIAAADRLGLDLPTDLLMQADETNKIAGLARSQAGSAEETAFRNDITHTATVADEALNQLSKYNNIAEASDDVKLALTTSHDMMKNQEKILYEAFDASLPKETPVVADNLFEVLSNTAKELGGEDKLSPTEKRLFALSKDQSLTYGALLREKQNIGSGTKNTMFPDVNDYQLGKIYDAIKQDQKDAVALNLGDDALKNLDIANSLTVKRKGIENQIIAGFGKKGEGSVASLIKQAIASGSKGDVAPLNKLLSIVPKEMHKDVIATALKELSSSGRAADAGTFDFANYAKMYDGLRRNSPIYKTVIETIGTDKAQMLQDLYTISKKIVEAKQNVLHTGKANQAIIAGLKGNSLMQAVVGKIIGWSTSKVTAGLVSPDFLFKTPQEKLQSIANLLRDPDFKQLIIDASKGKATTEAVNKVMETEAFKRVAKDMPKEVVKETPPEAPKAKPTKEEVKAKVEAKKAEKEGTKKVVTPENEATTLYKEVKDNKNLDAYKSLIIDESGAKTKGERNKSHNWFDVPIEDDFGQTVATKRIAGQRDITEAFTADKASIDRFMKGKATLEDLKAIKHDLNTFELSSDLRDEASILRANKSNKSVELSDGSIYDPFSKMTYSKKEWQDLMDEAMFSKTPAEQSRLEEWHKDSAPETKNEDGSPKVFYHGTKANFDTFDIEKSNVGNYGTGFYFGENAEAISKHFADKLSSNIMPAYLKADNLFDATKINKPLVEDYLKSINAEGFTPNYEIRPFLFYKSIMSLKGTESFKKFIQSKGYDGIIGQTPAVGKQIVVFSPEQIKSIHNKGTFSESNPNILMSQFKTKNATTKQEAQTIAQNLLGKHYAKHADTFEIVQSVEDLPQNIKDALYSVEAYHGSMKERTKIGADTFFTNKPEYAEQYAGKDTRYYPAKQKSEVYFMTGGQIYPAKIELDNFKTVTKAETKHDPKIEQAIISKAKADGYDGLIIKYEGTPREDYVPFSDNVVKLKFDAEILKSGGKARGIFDPKSGKAYIIADAMKANEVEGVILHELLHKNINNEVKAGKSRAEAIMGSRYESVVKRLDNLYKMGDKQVKDAFQKVTDANTPAQHRIEEVMTYLLENITNESKPLLIKWKDDVIAAIKAFIAKTALQLGMKAETVMSKLDSKDIANILRSEAIKNESMLKNIKR